MQVFALSSQADHVFFRSDVTSSELSGKEWKNVNIGRTITDSLSSLSSDSSHHEVEGTRGMYVDMFGDFTLYGYSSSSYEDESSERRINLVALMSLRRGWHVLFRRTVRYDRQEHGEAFLELDQLWLL